MSRPRIEARLKTAMVLAAGSIVLLVLTSVPWLAEAVAYLAPVLIVVLLLRLGHYPGERALHALVPPRCRRRAVARDRVRQRAPIRMPRGTALLASRLAGRAPPVLSSLR